MSNIRYSEEQRQIIMEKKTTDKEIARMLNLTPKQVKDIRSYWNNRNKPKKERLHRPFDLVDTEEL